LGVPDKLINKLVEKSKRVENFHLYTSCESHGKQAEFVRDGLDYDKFIQNLKSANVMMTINALGVFSITEFLDDIIKMKDEFGCQYPVFSVNILRFPSFLNIAVLPVNIKERIISKIEIWLDTNKMNDKLLDFERDHLRRLISYLGNIEEPHKGSGTQ
jgi:hypothetical protein